MDPKRNRDPESEDTKIVDDSDVEMIEDDPSDRDTIPPDGPLLTTQSIPPGDPEVEDALLDESLDDVFHRMLRVSTPPAPVVLSEEELEAQREAEFEALLEQSKKPV
ncbi:hypothetical protein K8R04_04455 [Candidatus Uhrbacteria bacterium]|nr:hypothetical protein [Candidatus Uhrbacteria bacterium]